MRYTSAIIASVVLAIVVMGCSKQPNKPEVSKTEAPEPAVSGRISQVLGAVVAEAEARGIAETKPTLAAGDTVTLKGKVMGTMHPFVDGRAAVVIGDDTTINSCDLMPDDHCRTPWDACCVASEILQAGTAMIQIVDAEGQVVKRGLKGIEGMRELSRMRVSGTVVSGGPEAPLVVNAEAIELL